MDLSGVWDTTRESEFFETVESVTRIEQRDTIVLFRDDATGAPRHFGSIVPSTGAFTLELPSSNLAFCTAPDPMSGTTDLDAQSYDASGWFDAVVPPVCVALVFTQTGTRQCPGGGCPPPPNAPAIPPLGGVSLGILLVFATWVLRRRLSSFQPTSNDDGTRP